MYVSYKHKVIFIHCRKAAGSSISYYLSRVGGARDIQLSAIVETLDAGAWPPLRTLLSSASGKEGILSFAKVVLSGNGLKNAIATGAKSSFRNRLGAKPQHASATIVKKVFDEEWRSFKSFCVVRNPFDLAVSDYFWRIRNSSSPPDFSYYLKALYEKDTLGGLVPVDNYYNWPRYTMNNQIIVDKILRFENLNAEITTFFKAVGIPFDGKLPRLKSKFRPVSLNSKSVKDIYCPRTKKLVEELYKEEIDYFGYSCN